MSALLNPARDNKTNVGQTEHTEVESVEELTFTERVILNKNDFKIETYLHRGSTRALGHQRRLTMLL